jgi:ubiquinol-cytochrome c reductase cytochrome c subunit
MTLEASDVTSAVSSAEAAPSGHRGKNARASAKPGKAGKRARSPRQKRKMPAGIVIVLGLMVMGFLWAAFAPSGRAADSAANNEQVRLGRALFLAGCSSCHGLSAEGGNQAPSLIGVGAAAVDFQVSTGRMPAPGQGAYEARKEPKFGEKDIEALAAYVQSIGGGPMLPTGNLRGPDSSIAEGGELFRLNCASCHGVTGGGAPLSAGKIAPELKHATDQQMYAAMLTGPESMPVFSNNQVTPEEKHAIIAYIQNLKESADPGGAGIGRIGPVSEAIVIWVAGVGAIMIAILWIGAKTGD